MQWITRKLGLSWDIIVFLAFAGGSFFGFYDYSSDHKRAHLIVGLISGLLYLAKLFDIFDDVRQRRRQLNRIE